MSLPSSCPPVLLLLPLHRHPVTRQPGSVCLCDSFLQKTLPNAIKVRLASRPHLASGQSAEVKTFSGQIGFLACDNLGWIFNPWPWWKGVNLPSCYLLLLRLVASLLLPGCHSLWLAFSKTELEEGDGGTNQLWKKQQVWNTSHYLQLPHRCLIQAHLLLPLSPPPSHLHPRNSSPFFSSLPLTPCSSTELSGSPITVAAGDGLSSSRRRCSRCAGSHAADWHHRGAFFPWPPVGVW